MMESTICPNCDHVFQGHHNVYGKICTRCGHEIEPLEKAALVDYMEKNAEKEAELVEEVKLRLRERMRK